MPPVKLFLKRKLFRGILVFTMISIMMLCADLSGILSIYERKSIDIRTRICRSETQLPSEIVLVIVDESSLNAMNRIAGRWPWPRNIHSELINFLSMCGAKSILFDVMFTENEFGPDFSKEGTAKEHTDSNDQLLVEATESSGKVYHAAQIFSDTADEYNKSMLNRPLPEGFINKFDIRVKYKDKSDLSNNYYLPFEALYTASKGTGSCE